MGNSPLDRRSFLSAFALVGAGSWLRPGESAPAARALLGSTLCGAAHAPTASHSRSIRAHPTPRKGITGAKVLPASELASRPELQSLFDGIRAIPAVADGIRCSCGCAELPGYYSLLSCFEGEAMSKICPICQGTGRLVVRLHSEGQTLAQIRIAVDAQYG
jgi:hypothetical protein